MDIIKMAFRNITRNLRRSILTSLSLFVAGFVVVVLHGYVSGFLNGMKDNVINLTSGHVIIAKKAYFERKFFTPVEEYIPNVQKVESELDSLKYLSFYVERLKSQGMLFERGTNKPVLLIGIDPEKERKTLELERKLISGKYDLKNGAIIGKGLARGLNLHTGDTVIILSKTTMGGLNGIKVKITGIANIGLSEFDKRAVFLSIRNMRRLLKMPEGVHEILVFLKKEGKIKDFIRAFNKNNPDIIARDYIDELGTFAFYFKLGKNIYYFIYFIIVLLATFAIINTMTVAVFERLREIGTLKALGMRDREIFALFGAEGTMLGTFGGILGSIVGWLFNILLHTKGINYESMVKGMSMPMPYIIRPEINFNVVIFSTILIIFVSFLASSVPAIYAKKLTPQEALREI